MGQVMWMTCEFRHKVVFKCFLVGSTVSFISLIVVFILILFDKKSPAHNYRYHFLCLVSPKILYHGWLLKYFVQNLTTDFHDSILSSYSTCSLLAWTNVVALETMEIFQKNHYIKIILYVSYAIVVPLVLVSLDYYVGGAIIFYNFNNKIKSRLPYLTYASCYCYIAASFLRYYLPCIYHNVKSRKITLRIDQEQKILRFTLKISFVNFLITTFTVVHCYGHAENINSVGLILNCLQGLLIYLDLVCRSAVRVKRGFVLAEHQPVMQIKLYNRSFV
ncbi:hypothetical protein HELRODRAFT_168986 [Helobdella robusta]|uniref:Uncharacterized protein n=1 Tax=Helobdella robusta TaxID=6412 RepID=T1F182_HELRO|nr:hypothetical protein HELRODRAFT_168986 [Helobdella robusta]ESO09052.1 hypothetical protein HELRODRAFT_168986 [Helobdella robusta]